jgi:3-hydroxybutyryl-CoA dehydrogenase
VDRIGVIGCGLMGSGIAEVCARAGLGVVVVERDQSALEHGRRRLTRSLEKARDAGKLSPEDSLAALSRLHFSTSFDDLADLTFVIEAVAEDEAVKLEVFHRLDEAVTDRGAIFASNTSSISIATLASATARPENVVGLHFFNPVPVMRLVEVTASLLTSEATVHAARTLASERLGKTPIASPDRAGFVVNALLIPYLLSAIRMVEAGVATAEDIDTAMTLGCAHPMGPLALTDLIGLDTTAAVAESLYAEFRETHYATPPLLSRMIAAGQLGRKSGQGFYSYRK